MTWALTLLLIAAIAGCGYGTPRTNFSDGGSAGSGKGGTGGSAGGQAGAGDVGGGTGGQAGTGGPSGTATGAAGVGGGGTGGSAAVFVGGPCIVSADRISAVEVFARASDGHIYRRAYDGRNWDKWANVPALDGTMIDARSDLDCATTFDTIHIVATGLNPVGALLHAFGSGTTYNSFSRELSSVTVAQSPSIALFENTAYEVGWADQIRGPGLFAVRTGMNPVELTPVTSLADSLISGVDIAKQFSSVFLAGFDSRGALAVYPLLRSSGGNLWDVPVKLGSPSGTFAFSPTICAETGLSGSSSVDVFAVIGSEVWFAGTPRLAGLSQFSPWTKVGVDAASAPDCVVLRENPNVVDAVLHVVTLSSHGTVLDLHGNGTDWLATDLGPPR
jgi:hypothetical protein